MLSTLFFNSFCVVRIPEVTRGKLMSEHPHRGFSIYTFILEGNIEHYDDKTNDRSFLNKAMPIS